MSASPNQLDYENVETRGHDEMAYHGLSPHGVFAGLGRQHRISAKKCANCRFSFT